MTDRQLLPGLPVSALMAFVPIIAAAFLVYRESGRAGVVALVSRAVDVARFAPKIWYLPALLLFPAVALLSYGLTRALGLPLPPPEFSVSTVMILFAVFLLPALTEEVGWTGYATDPLQLRATALHAALRLGAVQAVWHLVPLLQARRTPEWIAAWCVGTVAGRVLFVWLYNNAGRSVFGAILFHDMSNVSWQLFPVNGSHYDPRLSGFLLSVAAAAVVVAWGPRTLAQFSLGRGRPRRPGSEAASQVHPPRGEASAHDR
jgi:hypothetical protein